MNSKDLIGYFERQPFVPFEVLTTGGFVFPVIGPEFGYIGMNVLTVLVWDAEGRETVIDVDAIIALRTREPAGR